MLSLLSLASALSLDISAGSSFPTDVGLRGMVEGPGRVRGMFQVGLLPSPYLDAINQTAVSQEWYDQTTADLIEAALHHALALRLHAGWRPFPKLGFFLSGGYGFLGLGGGLTGSQAFAILTGYDIPIPGGYLEYDIHASLHRAEFLLGWEWILKEHLLIRSELGASYTFSAHSEMERNFDVPFLLEGILDDWETEGEDKLDSIFTRFVHTPIINLEVGWRF